MIFLFSGVWSSCMHHTCGDGGIQSRDVWCAHESGWATLENNCNPHTKPPLTQRCFHICPFHKYHFLWKKDSWTPCRPRPASGSCDHQYGVQYRNVSCVTKCGERRSQNYICENFEAMPAVEQICELKCPVDCILTDYGQWSSCDKCWMVNQTRHRAVLALPSNGGRQCLTLSQTRRCDYRSHCQAESYSGYMYKVGEWGECDLVDSKKRRRLRDFVGVLGQRARDVTCINSKGHPTDERYVNGNLKYLKIRETWRTVVTIYFHVSDLKLFNAECINTFPYGGTNATAFLCNAQYSSTAKLSPISHLPYPPILDTKPSNFLHACRKLWRVISLWAYMEGVGETHLKTVWQMIVYLPLYVMV